MRLRAANVSSFYNLTILTKIPKMNTERIEIAFQSFAKDEVRDADQALVNAACQATYTSYAPYSNFKVGAAVLLDNGEIVKGSNQENAAFGAGTCAERCALFYAHAQWPDSKVVAIAISARGVTDEYLTQPISPCGVCRQALIEAQKRAGAPVRVILVGRDKVFVLNSVSDLLPFQFDEIV